MTESRKAVSGFLKEESMFGKLQKKVFNSTEDVTVSVLPATLARDQGHRALFFPPQGLNGQKENGGSRRRRKPHIRATSHLSVL